MGRSLQVLAQANIVVANELPVTTVANTQYWVQTYNGQTLQNGRSVLGKELRKGCEAYQIK